MIEYYSLVLIQYYNELLQQNDKAHKAGNYVRLIENELRIRQDNFGNLNLAKDRLTAEKATIDLELKICKDKYNLFFDYLYNELTPNDWHTVGYLFHVRRVGEDIEIYSYLLASYEQCKSNAEDWKVIDTVYKKCI